MPIIKSKKPARFDLNNLPPVAPQKIEEGVQVLGGPGPQIQQLDEKTANEKAEEWKKDNFTNCEVNSEKVIKVLTRFVAVQKLVMDSVDSAIQKLSHWIENAPGQNDEEAANLYFLEQILEVLDDEENDEIDELNVLIIRLSLFRMKDHETNEPVFGFWEVLALTMACLSQDEMNQLELDNEFMKQLIEMPPYG